MHDGTLSESNKSAGPYKNIGWHFALEYLYMLKFLKKHNVYLYFMLLFAIKRVQVVGICPLKARTCLTNKLSINADD